MKKLSFRVEKAVDKVINQIVDFLAWAFRYPLWVLLGAFALFVGSVLFIPAGFIGIEFTKGGDRSEFIMELELDKNTTIQESNRVAKEVEALVRQFKDVETVYTNVGLTSSGRITSNTQYLTEVFVKLKDKRERDYKTSVFARHLKKVLMKQIPGLKVRPVEINIIGLRDDDAVQITLVGTDYDTLEVAARKLSAALINIPGAIEVQSSLDDGKRIVKVIPDRGAMEVQEIDLLQAGLTLRTAINGMHDFQFKNETSSLPINISLDQSSRSSIRDIQNLTVLNSSGAHIPFSSFADIREQNESSNIERMNRLPAITIKSQVLGRPAGTVSNELRSKIKNLSLNPDIQYIWGGATKRTNDGLASLMLALLASIFLIYLVLVTLYNSFSYPWVVLLSIPLAVIGAFLTLALTMEALSVFTILGLIILIGLVGKNSILVVDFANKLMLDNVGAKNAILESVRLRFRPVIMTNLTMIIGLLPIALSHGAGAEWKNGMAWALIGGLSSSLFLTFIVVPVIYLSIHKVGAKNKLTK